MNTTKMKAFRDMQANKAGFTLIEVIVVVVILGLIASISVPSMVGYIDHNNAKTCEYNRGIIIRSYVSDRVKDKTVVLSDYLGQESCPSGGVYSATKDAQNHDGVACSAHGGIIISDAEFEPDAPSAGSGNNVDTSTGGSTSESSTGTIIVTDSRNGHSFQLEETDWDKVLNKVDEDEDKKYGYFIPAGITIQDDECIYYFQKSPYLQAKDARNRISISDYAKKKDEVIVIKKSEIIILDDKDIGDSWGDAIWITPNKRGSFYYYNDSFYVLAYPANDSKWTLITPIDNNNWVILPTL